MGEPNLIEESSLKPNSHTYKKEQAVKQAPKLEAIVKGKTTQSTESSLWEKVCRTFIKDDVENVKEYIIFDVAIPALKNAISDGFTSAVNMFLFGENRPSSVKRSGDRSYVSYNNYYRSSGSTSRYSSDDSWRDRPYTKRGVGEHRTMRQFDQVQVPSRTEAEQVLNALVDRTILYGMASVADLYDLAGVPSQYTDNDWGWDSMEGSRIERGRDGYIIRTPQPHLLEE